MQPTTAALGGLLCLLFIGFPISLAIAAVILRAACSACGIAPPEFLRAMGIAFINYLASMAIGFVLGIALAAVGLVGPGTSQPMIQLKATLVGLPFQMLAAGGIFSAMLDTTFTKGILVWVAQFLIALVIVFVVVLVVVGVMMMLRPGA